MADAFPHGAPEFYLAAATVIPFLLVSYLFSIKVLEAIKKIIKADASVFTVFTIVALPLVAITAALLGEAFSLLALFARDPTSANAWFSSAGLVAFPVVGVIHLGILEGIDKKYPETPKT